MSTVYWQFLPFLKYIKWLEKKDLLKNKVLKENDNFLLFTEHNDIITVGKHGNKENILNVPSCKDIPVYNIDRGGDVTYHGKGQLMFYPIFPKFLIDNSVRKLVLFFEEVVIELLDKYKIRAFVREDFPGVWTENGKISAIGLNLSNGIITHGMSLYVNVDKEKFKCIVPCGLNDRRIDSISCYLSSVTVEETAYLWLNILSKKLRFIDFKEKQFIEDNIQ